MVEKQYTNKQKWFFSIVIFLIPVVTISLIYLAYVTYRTSPLYDSVKSSQRGWSGDVWRADEVLGFAPVADSQGSETMPDGPDIPARYDQNGFRIPSEESRGIPGNSPLVLTLGCSFTYGAATRAEDTYPYLVGEYIGGSTRNAGVCSYGLSQMVIIANKLIPRHKPDYVIVQYSPWLVERAVGTFAPSYFGKLPNPYYVEDDNLVIKPPVFQTKIFDLPIDGYRDTQEGFVDFLSFVWNVGLPLYFHDDINMGIYTFARVSGLKDQPATDRPAVIQHAYGEINRVAEQNGAEMIVVVIGYSNDPVPVQKELLPDDIIIVDARGALLENLSTVDRKSYERQYNHWRGDPLKLVDRHPNEKAHKIIAEEIASQIIESQTRAN